MMKQLYLLSFLIIFFVSATFAQNNNDNCPSLFTRSKIKNPKVQITKFEVVDSNKFTVLPQFVLDKDSVSGLFIYPEIAKRAGVEGIVIFRVEIDEYGKAIKANLIKGIGAGCDDVVLYTLLRAKYKYAKVLDKNIPSEIFVTVKFSLNIVVDNPDLVFDEIIYIDHSPVYFYKKIVLNKFGNVTYFEIDKILESEHDLTINKRGTINIDTYMRVSDFIISQCFLDYKDSYYYSASDHQRRETVQVISGSIEKSVTSIGDGDPVGLWAIIYVLRHIQDQIKWEEVKE